jgi:hypothetical protein
MSGEIPITRQRAAPTRRSSPGANSGDTHLLSSCCRRLHRQQQHANNGAAHGLEARWFGGRLPERRRTGARGEPRRNRGPQLAQLHHRRLDPAGLADNLQAGDYQLIPVGPQRREVRHQPRFARLGETRCHLPQRCRMGAVQLPKTLDKKLTAGTVGRKTVVSSAHWEEVRGAGQGQGARRPSAHHPPVTPHSTRDKKRQPPTSKGLFPITKSTHIRPRGENARGQTTRRR